MFQLDTHVHTKEVSGCASISAVDLVGAMKRAGYDGIIITDHYYRPFFERMENLSWTQKVDVFLTGYRHAKIAGEKVGLSVFLGMEIHVEEYHSDFLVYGLSEEFYYQHPMLYTLTLQELYDIIAQNGGLIFQAHPFRVMCERGNPQWMDGVEVFNGNMRHNSHNDKAEDFAHTHQLIAISGSDFHEWEDLGNGGIRLPHKITDNQHLVQALKSETIELMKVRTLTK